MNKLAGVTLPLRRHHRALFIAGAVAVLLVPVVHAYLLMPFPGSQDLEAIKLAYYLEKALRPLLVLGVLLLALSWDDLVSGRALEDTVGGVPILLTVEEDGMSFHAFRRDLRGETLTFSREPGGKAMIETATGDHWSLRGVCFSGRNTGLSLAPVQAHQEYWHSWKNFHPTTAKWTASP
jgi:hypothetical protein